MNRTPKVFYLTFWVFRLSESWEMQPMAFFILPNIGKAVFCRFLIFPREGKLIFVDFYPSYPYESFFFPFFINCTPYLGDFSRKSMIYSRI